MVDTASTAAVAAWAARQTATIWPRCIRSAQWPATSVVASPGMNWKRPTRPRYQALDVRSYMCQLIASMSICCAVIEPTRAIRKRANDECRSKGVNPPRASRVGVDVSDTRVIPDAICVSCVSEGTDKDACECPCCSDCSATVAGLPRYRNVDGFRYFSFAYKAF